MDPNTVGLEFVNQYYTAMEAKNAQQLLSFYLEDSRLTWEDDECQGKAQIWKNIQKFISMNIRFVRNKVVCHYIPGAGFLVNVFGAMKVCE
ncbi:unnamed protein product [Clavelina lepadiformis]|uniref:NTF2 domain-containing protein n=1 Tax=Clavelina lepadiformis TaxID=159417 RepID=A0ABP0FZR0_CLALP